MIFMSKRNLTNFTFNETMRGLNVWRNLLRKSNNIDVIFLFCKCLSRPYTDNPVAKSSKNPTYCTLANQLTISLPLSSSDGLCCGPEAGAG